ncbi:DUF1127 domain-containing protein [Pelagibius marinus]|uniref:DUF1127 domain-containing protein n=1 Tax=Pelagibius marinus TaxID=2762760 RepID=UPI0018723837|nr:DUF1127 domain-containing protein [Pelagibius marinus]
MTSTAIHAPSPCRPATPTTISDYLLRYLRRAGTRRALAGLTPEQRRDVGIGPAEGPVYQDDPRTMIRLMSLR